MNLIECRSCNEPDCAGCNLYQLAFALRHGWFDACKDDNNAVRITSEVAPVVHGKWTFHSDAKKGFSECSVCKWHYMHEVWHEYGPRYCPRCGAKMDGGQKN